MGFSEKKQHQGLDVGLDSDTKKWVIAGIPLRTPLKPIYTTDPRPPPVLVDSPTELRDDDQCLSTTPTGEESKIPTRLTCPPAPRKKKSSSKCKRYGSAVIREFFTPPDLETVFKLHHVERAN